VESGSPLTPSECAAPVENVKDIAEGHTVERVKPQKWLSSRSYGKDTATVLFSAPEASFASSDGASVEKQGLEGCNDHPSAEGSNFKFRSAGEGATREVSITSASENNVREVLPRNPPTVPLKEVGNTPREIGRAAGGRAPEVQNSTPSAKAKKRRTPPKSGTGTPPHADAHASRRKRTAANKPEVDTVWGAWHEQQQAALQHRNGVREDQLLAIQSSEEMPMSVSPYNSRRGPTRGSPGEVSTPSGHRNKRPGSPCTS
ncbi:unnamed protein product, partial [Sphacelaria rigidula]